MKKSPVPKDPVDVFYSSEWVKTTPADAEVILNKPGPITSHEDLVILATNLNVENGGWAWWIREDGVIRSQEIDNEVTEDNLRSSTFQAKEDVQDAEVIYLDQNGVLYYFYKRAS